MLRQRIEERYNLIVADTDGLRARIEKEVRKPKFFKDWLSYDGLDERFSMMLSKDEDELTKEDRLEAGQELFDEIWNEFEDEFYDKANWSNGRLLGYRCIGLDESKLKKFIDSLKKGKYLKGFTGVGIFFSWDEKSAECHWGEGNTYVTVVAEIPVSSIDFKGTAYAVMSPSTGREEREVRVKGGAKIFVTEIRDKDDKNLLGDDVKALPAVAEI